MADYYLKYLKYKTKYLKVMKGGEKIGKGEYGIVFRPPLFLVDRDQKYESRKYVGKIMTLENALAESKNSDIIKALDPDGEWSVTIKHLAPINSKQLDIDLKSPDIEKFPIQLISEYKGISLKNLIGFEEDSEGTIKLENAALFFKLVQKLVPVFIKLNETHLHNDIHLGNFVYDDTDDTIRIMDFGKLIKSDGSEGTSVEGDLTDLSGLFNMITPIYNGVRRNERFKPVLQGFPTNPHKDPSPQKYAEAILSIPNLSLL
jgi:hypothetical protein